MLREERKSLKIKAVLFDLGGTLVKTWNPEDTFQRVLHSLKISRSYEQVREALAKTNAEFDAEGYNLLYGKIPYKEFWSRWDSLVLKNLGIPDDEKLGIAIQDRWFDYAECSLYSDVEETLFELKKMNLKVGLVSTAYEEDIDAILKRAKIRREQFDVIVGANTLKKTKPHPDVFKYALAELKVKPEEAVFIGDAIDADYEGSEKMGLKALLIQREESSADKKLGVRTIIDLREVFNFIN
jgi:putative hydrolase of the HAD superfamily